MLKFVPRWNMLDKRILEEIIETFKFLNYKKYFPSLYITESKLLHDNQISQEDSLLCHEFCTTVESMMNDSDIQETFDDLHKNLKREKVKLDKGYYKFKDGVVYNFDFEDFLFSLKSISIIMRAVFQEKFKDQEQFSKSLYTVEENLLKHAILNKEIEEMTSYEYAEFVFLTCISQEFQQTLKKIEENTKGVN